MCWIIKIIIEKKSSISVLLNDCVFVKIDVGVLFVFFFYLLVISVFIVEKVEVMMVSIVNFEFGSLNN